MALVEIDWRPSPTALRKFGVSMLVGFGIIGSAFYFGWPMTANQSAAYGLWIFGAVAGLLGLSGTRVALLVYYPWMGIGFVMGNIMSRLFLASFYFTTITIIALFFRLTGRDKLRLKRRTTDSYWVDLDLPEDKARYERQF